MKWLGELADRLVFGVKPDALPVMRLRIPRLGRVMVRRLRDAGLLDAGALDKCQP